MRLPFRTGGLLTETDGDYGQHYRENEQKRNFYIQHSGKVWPELEQQLQLASNISEYQCLADLRSFFLASI